MSKLYSYINSSMLGTGCEHVSIFHDNTIYN